jgi:hypothetical protein
MVGDGSDMSLGRARVLGEERTESPLDRTIVGDGSGTGFGPVLEHESVRDGFF